MTPFNTENSFAFRKLKTALDGFEDFCKQLHQKSNLYGETIGVLKRDNKESPTEIFRIAVETSEATPEQTSLMFIMQQSSFKCAGTFQAVNADLQELEDGDSGVLNPAQVAKKSVENCFEVLADYRKFISKADLSIADQNGLRLQEFQGVLLDIIGALNNFSREVQQEMKPNSIDYRL